MKTTVLRFVGGAGSGKSTALQAFADERRSAGLSLLYVSGDSTPQGLKQALAAKQYKAVLIDEGRPGDSEGLASSLMGLGLDHIVLACSKHPAEEKLAQALEQNERLLADLTEAAATLRRYETLHRAKGTDDSTAKAEVNAKLAARFEATIAACGSAFVEPQDGFGTESVGLGDEVREYPSGRALAHNGGPAFPRNNTVDKGMTLRDYFAAKSMAALTPVYWDTQDQYESGPALIKCQAESAYEMADAMLAEREKAGSQ